MKLVAGPGFNSSVPRSAFYFYESLISTRLQSGVDDGQNAKPVLTGSPRRKVVETANFSFFFTVTRLKPGANEMFLHNRSKIKMHHGHSAILDLGRNFLRWLRVLDILLIPNRGVEQPGSSSGS